MNKILKWILIIFAFIVLLGILGGSSDQPAQSTTQNADTAAQSTAGSAENATQAPAQSSAAVAETGNAATTVDQPAQNPDTNTATEEVYQDYEWVTSVTKHSSLIVIDLDAITDATNNMDYNALEEAGKYLEFDTQKALDESSNYTVSSTYQEAKAEYEASLADYINAGHFTTLGAQDLKNGSSNLENLNKAVSYVQSAGVHIKRSTALVEAINRT